MTTVQQAIADLEMTLPEVITGHVDGTALPVKKEATQHAVHFPGTGEQISSLQEDDPAAVANAIECAKSHFQHGAWSGASTATRQSVFRRAATLIREHAETLGLLECLCAGLPSS
ncbi:aldehyde dehydrogenase family protein, partial [Luminiphilus sp.]|nr:aldehyde dehydrogenase family protein [Luminiphilus sp.]